MATRNPALYNQLIWELYPHYLQGLGYIPGGAGFLPSTVWQHDLEKIWKQDVLIKTVYSLHLALWSEMSKLSVVSNLQYLSQAIIPTNELCVCHIVNLGNQGLCIKRIRAHRNYEDLWGCIHSQDRKNRQRSNEMVTLLDAWPVLRPISEPTSHIVGLPGTLPGRLPEWVPGTRSCPRLAVLQQILGKASHLDHMMAALCCFCLTAWLLDCLTLDFFNPILAYPPSINVLFVATLEAKLNLFDTVTTTTTSYQYLGQVFMRNKSCKSFLSQKDKEM